MNVRQCRCENGFPLFWIALKEKAKELLQFPKAQFHRHIGPYRGDVGVEIVHQLLPSFLVGLFGKMGSDFMKEKGIDETAAPNHESVARGGFKHIEGIFDGKNVAVSHNRDLEKGFG